MKVLFIENEKRLSEAMEQILKINHYLVDVALDGESGLDNALIGIYDAIILDIMLPKIDGISVLKEMRDSNITTPVILLTAKSEIEDKIYGLDSGADDYLTKPFEIGEFLARLRALTRRSESFTPSNRYIFADVELNPDTLLLSCAQQSIKLTVKEYQLMKFLILRQGFLTPKNMIIEKIWGYDSEINEHNVEVYISFLRKKLKLIKAQVIIRSERGSGYSLTEKV